MTRYTSTCVLRQEPVSVLAVHCSDHRFQAGLRQFLDDGLGLRANYDVLVVFGGPQALLPMEALPKFAWAARKWLRYLVRAHRLDRLLLIAHQDCGWYKWLAEQIGTVKDPRTWQLDDLGRVAGLLAADFPKLTIETYFAAWDGGGYVTVDRVGD